MLSFPPKSFLPKARAVVLALILALTLVVLVGQSARAVGIGETCAGRAGLGCDDGLWCELEPGACKRADVEGRCVRAPEVCNLAYIPVCGCDGHTYGNDCERKRAKAQKAHSGSCR